MATTLQQQQLNLYLQFVRASALRSGVRERALVLAGESAQLLSYQGLAEAARQEILENNPRHLLRRYPNFKAALADREFHAFLTQLHEKYPPDRVVSLVGTAAENSETPAVSGYDQLPPSAARDLFAPQRTAPTRRQHASAAASPVGVRPMGDAGEEPESLFALIQSVIEKLETEPGAGDCSVLAEELTASPGSQPQRQPSVAVDMDAAVPAAEQAPAANVAVQRADDVVATRSAPQPSTPQPTKPQPSKPQRESGGADASRPGTSQRIIPRRLPVVVFSADSLDFEMGMPDELVPNENAAPLNDVLEGELDHDVRPTDSFVGTTLGFLAKYEPEQPKPATLPHKQPQAHAPAVMADEPPYEPPCIVETPASSPCLELLTEEQPVAAGSVPTPDRQPSAPSPAAIADAPPLVVETPTSAPCADLTAEPPVTADVCRDDADRDIPASTSDNEGPQDGVQPHLDAHAPDLSDSGPSPVELPDIAPPSAVQSPEVPRETIPATVAAPIFDRHPQEQAAGDGNSPWRLVYGACGAFVVAFVALLAAMQWALR